MSIATAVLPAISRHAARDDLAGIRSTVSRVAGHDADAQRSGDARPARARPPIVEFLFEHGRFTAGRHGRHRCGAALLRHRPGRLFGRADRVADLLRAAAEPDAVAVSIAAIAANVVLSVSLVQPDGIPGSGAGHLDRRHRQRRPAGLAAAAPPATASKAARLAMRHGEDPRGRRRRWRSRRGVFTT